tara:strand:+ start:242 stop:565 length:324 start_codon:yes stop_codon:yes gene_type:complete
MKPKIVQPEASPGLSQEELDAKLKAEAEAAEKARAAAAEKQKRQERRRRQEEKKKMIAIAQNEEAKRLNRERAAKATANSVSAQGRAAGQVAQSGGAYSQISGTGYN